MLDMKTFTGVQRFCIAGIGIILLFALLVSRCEAQTGIIRFPQWYEGNGDPVGSSLTTFPGLANGAAYKNRLTGDKFYFKNGTVKWVKDNTIGLPTKGDTGPQGPIGPQGPPGSGGGGTNDFINGYLQNSFGQINIAGTNQATLTVTGAGVNPAVFVGAGIVGTDLLDWANWKYAIMLSLQTGKKINAYGKFKGINKAIPITKLHYDLWIEGQAYIYTSNANTFAVFDSEDPVNQNEAGFMVSGRKWTIDGLLLYLQGSQIGFDLEPNSHMDMRNIRISGGSIGIWARFALTSTYTNICGVDVKNVIIVDASPNTDVGTVSRASTTLGFDNIQGYCGPGGGTVVIQINYAEFITINRLTFEGGKWTNGVVWNTGGNGNYRSLTITGLYAEAGVPPYNYASISNGEAAVKILGSADNVNISMCKAIYPIPLLYVDAPGFGIYEVNHNAWWPTIGGKLVYTVPTAIGPRYKFNTWSRDYIDNANNAPAMFAGKSINYGCPTANDQSINTVCMDGGVGTISARVSKLTIPVAGLVIKDSAACGKTVLTWNKVKYADNYRLYIKGISPCGESTTINDETYFYPYVRSMDGTMEVYTGLNCSIEPGKTYSALIRYTFADGDEQIEYISQEFDFTTTNKIQDCNVVLKGPKF